MVNFNSCILFRLKLSNHFLPLILLILFCASNLSAQEGSTVFTSGDVKGQQEKGTLALLVDNLNFFKNNEYKSDYVSGYTLTGAWLRPKLLYYPDKKVRVEIGGHLLSYIGREDYKLSPWFAVQYQPTKNLTFRMGNLNEDQNHGLMEPVRDSERYFTAKPEAGIQGKFKGKKVKVDVWIDWQQMIFKGDPYKERFTFGAFSEFKLLGDKTYTLSLPVTFNGLHEGGEIDAAAGLAQTHITVSEALKFRKIFHGSPVKAWSLSGAFLQSTYPQGETALTTKQGTALYLQSAVESKYGKLSAGYWRGENFFTPLGMPLFQNGAIGSTHSTALNELVTFSYLYDRIIFEQSKFGFAFDAFYHPVTGKISNSAALYLVVNFQVLSPRGLSNKSRIQ